MFHQFVGAALRPPGPGKGPTTEVCIGRVSTFAIAVISTWESVFVVCNIGPDIYQSQGEIVARKWFIRVFIRTATSAQSVATFLLTGLLAHSRNMTESTTRFMKHCTIIRSPSAIRKIHIDKVTKVFQFHSHRGHWSTLQLQYVSQSLKFQNHGECPYQGLLLVKSAYCRFHIYKL